MLDMRRREFLTLLGGAAAGWPIAAYGQQRAKPARIGYLSAASPPDNNLESFRAGMRALGYDEGRDFVLEPRFAGRDYSRFPALVEELLRARIDLMVAAGPASRAAPFAAASVPVVFGFSGDPVDAGIVASFARPGGNATGLSFLSLDLAVKRLDLLKEAMPTMTRVAVLSNPDHAGDASELRATRETARALGLAIEHFEVRTDDGFEPVFAAVAESKCDGLLSFPDALTNFNRQKIVAFALRRRLPSIYGWKMYAQVGGLMSYGPVLHDAFARLGTSGRHLRGPVPSVSLACLENVPKPGYFGRHNGFAMKAARVTTQTIMREAPSRRLWRRPLAFGLALALVVALFHDLPALAGTAGSDPTAVAAASSPSTPVQAPDSQAPAVGCHCLCHMAAQAMAAPIVTPVVFDDSLSLPPDSTAPRSCAGVPPFRPPRV